MIRLLLFAAFSIATCYGQACPYSVCSCQETVIDCTDRGLTEIPPRANTGASFTTLLLSGNLISNISRPQSFPISLSTIDLRNNPVVEIDSQALYEIAQSLKVIRFSKANFTTVPEALETLDNLEILDIEGMNLNFPVATASKLGGSLIELRLVNLNLRSWPTFLQYFVFLRKLYLDDNARLGNPPAGTFDIWRHEMTHLSLSNTGLVDTSALSVLEKLVWLDLSSNRIADTVVLSYDLIPLGETLTYLDLSNNQLIIEPRLVEMKVLAEVNLSRNKLNTTNSGAFGASVRTITIDNNLFKEIPDFFNDLIYVSNFSMRYNQIETLVQADFPVSSRLTSLHLGGNPLTTITQHAFDNVRSVTYLDLENTKMTRLPLGVTLLNNLATLWMPNNANLICTCEEKAIATWITGRPTMQVVGHCGSVDIREYMGHLATLCP